VFFLQLRQQVSSFFCSSSSPKEGMLCVINAVRSEITVARQELSEEKAHLTVMSLHPICDVT
ncbi:hypothetical protein J6590_094340, partial [Homalodisca vitripennis]